MTNLSIQKGIIMFLFSVTCSISNAQQQTFINKDWSIVSSNAGNHDHMASTVDPSGNLVFIGNKFNGNNTDIFLTCIHPDGSVVWQETCSSSPFEDDYGVDLVIDPSGNIYLTGAHYNGSNLDYLTAKYSPSGTLIWQHLYNGMSNGDDVPAGIAIDSYGAVYVTGTSAMSNMTDFATIKLNNSGVQQWVQFYNYSNKAEVAKDILVDSNGDIVVCGTSAQNWLNSDFVVIKYSSAGGQIDIKRHNTPGNGYDVPAEMGSGANGNIVIVGTADATGNKNIKTIAYSSNLQVQWVKYIDKAGQADEGYGLCLDLNGNPVITGYCTRGTGASEFYVAKLNSSNGSIYWENGRAASIPSNTSKGRKVVADDYGNVYAAGEVEENGSLQYSLISFNQHGRVRFSRDFDFSQTDMIGSIACKGESLYLTGVSGTASNKQNSALKVSLLEKNQPVTYCEGEPCTVDDELLVRFAPDYLDYTNVDNTNKTWGILKDFVEPNTLSMLSANVGFEMGGLTCYKVYPNITSADTTSTSRFGNQVQLPPFFGTFGVLLPAGSNDFQVMQNLNKSTPFVLVATENGFFELTAGANDPFYNDGSSAGLIPSITIPNGNINIEGAWDRETGTNSITVGVYDSGINYAHTDLSFGNFATSSVSDGWDYVNNSPITATPNPDNTGHGSAVAGIIGAWRNNNFGIAGVAGGPSGMGGVELHAMKILDSFNCTGVAAPINIILNALVEGSLGIGLTPHAVQNHSWKDDVTNGVNPLIREAFRVAYENEVVVCAASGNRDEQGANPCEVISYPASFRDHMIMKIGANDEFGAKADFSECGFGLDLIAPGVHELYIGLGINGNNFTDFGFCGGFINGTSYASPHAAGVAALMLSYADNNPLPNSFSHEDCEQMMQRNATDLVGGPNSPGYDNQTGWGRLNAGALFDSLEFPEFLIQHYNFIAPTNNATLDGSFQKVCLEMSLFGLPTGVTDVKRWKYTASTNHSVPAGYTLIDGWARGSGSTSVGNMSFLQANCNTSTNNYYLPAETDASLDLFTSTSATMTGYTYELLDSTMTPVGWWPVDTTGSVVFAYSLYLKDILLEISEERQLNFLIYPNPSKHNFIIEYNVASDKKSEIIISDVSGKTIKIVSHYELKLNGGKMFISTSELAQGLYFVTLRRENESITKRLVIQK